MPRRIGSRDFHHGLLGFDGNNGNVGEHDLAVPDFVHVAGLARDFGVGAENQVASGGERVDGEIAAKLFTAAPFPAMP